MTALLSAISGHFSKNLILGTFFPAVFFVLVNVFLLEPFVPSDWPPLEALRALETGWETLAVAGLTILFSGLLYNLNIPVIRFYEGYPWKHSLLGKWLAGRKRRRFRRERAMLEGSWGVRAELRRGGRKDELLPDLYELTDTLGRRLNSDFPLEEDSVLPTRLGNVIRSFEDYPRRQYGMSAIILWPRLAGVVDSGYAGAIEETKTSFDFMINASFLSAGSALLLLLLGLASPGALAGEWLPWAMEVAVFAAGAYLFYLGSISRAAGWGATVKSAFDLYRGKLLDQLGFKQKPGSMLGERALWEAISRQMIYGDPPAHVGSPPAYGGPSSPSARGKPSVAELRVTRAMASAPPGRTRVMLRVGNPDKERDVKGVVVTDVVPEGHLYLWGSARAAGEPVQVTGSNPYRFELGTVPAGSEVVLEYRYVQPGK